MSDRGLLLARRCGTINGSDLASMELQGPPSVAEVWIFIYQARLAQDDASRLQCGWSGGAAEGQLGLQEGDLLGWKRWTEIKKWGEDEQDRTNMNSGDLKQGESSIFVRCSAVR